MRSCPALPALKVLSVSKSIFTIPAIRITIDFSKHYISEPNTRVFASFRAISAALHAAEQGTTLPFSVAVVASACVRFHAVVVGVLVLA